MHINTHYLSGFSFLKVHLSNDNSLHNKFPLLFILFFVTFPIKNCFFFYLFFKAVSGKVNATITFLTNGIQGIFEIILSFAENSGHPFRSPVLVVSFWRTLQFVLTHPVTPHLPPPLQCLDTNTCVWIPVLFSNMRFQMMMFCSILNSPYTAVAQQSLGLRWNYCNRDFSSQLSLCSSLCLLCLRASSC